MRSSKINEPCIIIRLRGGLGNQLFIYAFAKSISMKNKVPLKLDTVSGFSNDKTYRREYLLHHLSIEDVCASSWESFHHLWGERRRRFVKRYNRFIPLEKRSYITERVKAFDEDIFRLPITKTVYFNGYWQSYKYFEWIDEHIRERFTLHLPMTPEVLEEARLIESCNSVCLGIRRFEEVPDERRYRINTPGRDYYEKAMQMIEGIIPGPHFFIFTQDRNWAREHLSLSNHDKITFIQERDPHLGSVIDLWLMTLCKHHVISNSTLHWWGAWLNSNDNKVVIAPKNGWGNEDILPSGWLTISPGGQ